MAEEKKKKIVRQDWQPHWVVNMLHKVWLALFAAFKIAAGAAATVLIICGVCGFVFVGLLGDYLEEDILPAAEQDLEDTTLDQTSWFYYLDSNGEIQRLQQVFATTSREWASYEEIPEHIIYAAVAIEDKRFYEHQGVDWVTTIKACANMFFGDSTVGGSSITQQLIKNIRLTEDETADDVTVQRKVLEIFRAVQLEKNYDKNEIMEWYLNTIYLGQGCGGIKSAAATYFGKELETLTIAECASLISITNNPSLFDPYSDNVFEYRGQMMNGMERNRHRQKLVLGEMLDQGWITEQEYREAINQELVLKNGIDIEDRIAECPNENCGYRATAANFANQDGVYYCSKCGTETPVDSDSSQSIYSWYVETALDDVAKALAEKDGMQWNDSVKSYYMEKIRKGGYHIYTCLDMDVQNQIDEIYKNLDNIPDTRSGQQIQSAIVVIDNETGDISGIAGGVGEKLGFDSWNRAEDAKLQSGSSFKPLAVYAPAFELGAITPATVVPDLPFDYSDGAWPRNDNFQYSYSRTILSAVVASVNASAVHTLSKISPEMGYEYAKEKLGISSLTDSYRAYNGEIWNDFGYAQLALGAQTVGVTVRDMSSAFATFANNGVYRRGRTFTKVYDSQGNLVLDNTQYSSKVFSEKTVDYMNYCLTNAVLSGTGSAANDYFTETAIAGKTGSTSSFKDRWFCGFTHYYTAAVWTGYDTPEVISVTDGSGSNPAVTLWRRVMAPLHDDVEWVNLYNSSKLSGVTMCLDSGKVATEACHADIRTGGEFTRTAGTAVYAEDYPGEVCNQHILMDYCTSGGGVATEYCKHFAEVDPQVKIEKKGLLKITQAKIDEMLRARSGNLSSEFFTDDYVYLVNEDGTDSVFYGINGTLVQKQAAPYKVCQAHTQQTWEEYQQANQQPTDPNADPNASVIPGAPSVPGSSGTATGNNNTSRP